MFTTNSRYNGSQGDPWSQWSNDSWDDSFPTKTLPTKPVPTETFGQVVKTEVKVGLKNLVLKGTEVDNVSAEGNIQMSQRAKVISTEAKGAIEATDCSLVETVKSGSNVTLKSCKFGDITAEGSITISNSTSQKPHSLILANGNVVISDSNVNNVQAGGKITVIRSTIHNTLTLFGSSALSSIDGSKIKELIVFPSRSPSNLSNISFDTWEGVKRHYGPIVTLHLTDTTVEKVEFVGCQGKLILNNKSRIIGEIKQGQIVSDAVYSVCTLL